MPKDTNTLFLAWQDRQPGTIWPVGRLAWLPEQGRFEFAYIQGAARAQEFGFTPIVGFPQLERVYDSPRLFPFFANRLMPSSRPDYEEYAERLELPMQAEPTTFLARSEGPRMTDRFEVFGFPTHGVAPNILVYHFFVRGIRHLADAEAIIQSLNTGTELVARPEPDNLRDTMAVCLATDQHAQVGWIPRVLLEDFHDPRVHRDQLRIKVVRVNPHPAPIRHRLLCALSLAHDTGFSPFSSFTYQPISPDAQSGRINADPVAL
jgi:hypothetical protein